LSVGCVVTDEELAGCVSFEPPTPLAWLDSSTQPSSTPMERKVTELGAEVEVGVGVKVDVAVGVDVLVAVEVDVLVTVAVGVAVTVAVGVAVTVAVGVSVSMPSA